MKKFLPLFLTVFVVLFLLVSSMGLFTPVKACYPPTKTPLPTITKTVTPMPTLTKTRIVPTEIIIPTGTVVSPTSIPPTKVPPSCEPYFTGTVLYQLHMRKSNPLHYGYFLPNGDKEGICQIVTRGFFPNSLFVQQYCNCKMPLNFSWRTDSYDVFQIWKTCDGQVFYKDSNGQVVAPFGTFVFGLYCSSSSCPVR